MVGMTALPDALLHKVLLHLSTHELLGVERSGRALRDAIIEPDLYRQIRLIPFQTRSGRRCVPNGNAVDQCLARANGLCESLDLIDAGISVNALSRLRNQLNLKKLNVTGCRNVDVPRLLPLLRGLHDLRVLRVARTRINGRASAPSLFEMGQRGVDVDVHPCGAQGCDGMVCEEDRRVCDECSARGCDRCMPWCAGCDSQVCEDCGPCDCGSMSELDDGPGACSRYSGFAHHDGSDSEDYDGRPHEESGYAGFERFPDWAARVHRPAGLGSCDEPWPREPDAEADAEAWQGASRGLVLTAHRLPSTESELAARAHIQVRWDHRAAARDAEASAAREAQEQARREELFREEAEELLRREQSGGGQQRRKPATTPAPTMSVDPPGALEGGGRSRGRTAGKEEGSAAVAMRVWLCDAVRIHRMLIHVSTEPDRHTYRLDPLTSRPQPARYHSATRCANRARGRHHSI